MQIIRHIFKVVFVFIGFLIKSALLLLFPAFIMWANYTIDSGGVFKGASYERQVAQALLDGSNLIGYDSLNEREINKLFVNNLQEPLDTIALGSSRVMQLRAKDVQADSFYNLGMSGADIRDILNSFYLFDKADKLPKNMIISLDPWLLNGNDNAYNTRSDIDLYNEFLTLKLAVDAGYTAPDDILNWKELLSPIYLQENMEYYFHTQYTEKKPGIVENNLYNQNTNVKMADGSVLYTPLFRNSDAEECTARAREEAATFLRMDGFIDLDPSLCDIFDRFIQYAKYKNVNIVFVLMPYHPQVYAYAQEYISKYPGFFKTEPWFTSYARKNNIPLYGSYNPLVTGNFEDDFFDGLHIKETGIKHFLPNISSILSQQRVGMAGNPWLYAPPRVSVNDALYFASSRYQIAPPHLMQRLDDVWINEQYCYMFGRFDSDAENATLLARYAISQDNGNMYRWDTDINDWVWYTLYS